MQPAPKEPAAPPPPAVPALGYHIALDGPQASIYGVLSLKPGACRAQVKILLTVAIGFLHIIYIYIYIYKIELLNPGPAGRR
jgi:hypothetical protein